LSQKDEIRLQALPQSQLELEIFRALLDDAERDIMLWLRAKPSAQEQVCLHAMQPRLGEIYRIVTHQIEGRASPNEDKERVQIGQGVLSLLHKAKEVRGCVVGESWDRLVNYLAPERDASRRKVERVPAEPKPAAGRDQKQDNAEQQPELAPKSWQELEIAFLSDERVEICCGGTNRQTYNYAELGFQDRRNEKPNRAWVMLREIAEKKGTIPRPSPGKDRAKIQKRMEEIREKLLGRFNIEADPIPFNGNTYQASFKISCRASFET
jgi:hypothetical protein